MRRSSECDVMIVRVRKPVEVVDSVDRKQLSFAKPPCLWLYTEGALKIANIT